MQVCSVEGLLEGHTFVELQHTNYILLNRRGGSGSQGYQGDTGELPLEEVELEVVWPVIVTPLGNAVGFVHHETLKLTSLLKARELFAEKPAPSINELHSDCISFRDEREETKKERLELTSTKTTFQGYNTEA